MSKDTTSTTEPRSLEDYVLLGRSGLRVSPLCLGVMTFGDTPGYGIGKEESKKIFDLYYEKRGNFFDTANIYCAGQSETFLGDYISDKRSNVVVATKYSINLPSMIGDKNWNPNVGGNHRKSLVENLDASLKRMNMSYVDILYVHIYEYRTPIEEIMRSLDDVVRSGKSLYVAVSDVPAWALARSNTMAELRGWSRFIGLQTRYNLLDRSLEYDLQPACAELDVGIIPWGCIAEGFLTGKYSKESLSSKTGIRSKSVSSHAAVDKNWEILDEVIAISKEVNRSPVQVALNWIQQKPGITSPLIGASTVTQLEENLKSLEFKLTPEQMERLDKVSNPKGHEVPFPQNMNHNFEVLFGRTVEMPKKFQAAMNFPKYDLY